MKTRYHKPPEDKDEPYLPVKTAAGIARLNLEAIYSAIRGGRLKYVLVTPTTARIRLSDLNTYLASRNKGSLS